MNKRIGIFSGSFDPVHKGHISLALEAIKTAKLDEVYFLPEVKPRRKPNVSHISHRLAMLNTALRPHLNLKVLELPDRQFKVATSLPKIKGAFKNADLFLIAGLDVARQLKSWPLAETLLKQTGLVIAAPNTKPTFTLPAMPKELHLIKSPMPLISSTKIRGFIEKGKVPIGLPKSLEPYIKAHWLYSEV